MSPSQAGPKQESKSEKLLRLHREQVASYVVGGGAAQAPVSRRIAEYEDAMLGLGLIMLVQDTNDEGEVVSEQRVTMVDGLPSLLTEDDDREPDFTHWVKPLAYTRKWTQTPEELLASIAQHRAIYASDFMPDATREKAEQLLRSELESAAKRGIAVPEGYVPTAKTKVEKV